MVYAPIPQPTDIMDIRSFLNKAVTPPKAQLKTPDWKNLPDWKIVITTNKDTDLAVLFRNRPDGYEYVSETYETTGAWFYSFPLNDELVAQHPDWDEFELAVDALAADFYARLDDDRDDRDTVLVGSFVIVRK